LAKPAAALRTVQLLRRLGGTRRTDPVLSNAAASRLGLRLRPNRARPEWLGADDAERFDAERRSAASAPDHSAADDPAAVVSAAHVATPALEQLLASARHAVRDLKTPK
jgi:hypothetical protein